MSSLAEPDERSVPVNSWLAIYGPLRDAGAAAILEREGLDPTAAHANLSRSYAFGELAVPNGDPVIGADLLVRVSRCSSVSET